MNVGILLTGNLVGGGVKMPVRLASALAEDHDVTLLYPIVPHYVTYHRLRRTGWAAQARFIAIQAFRHRGELFFRPDLDDRVRVVRYFLTPDRRRLQHFDVVVYQSVWQHYELNDVPARTRRVHWSLADYLFCSGLNADVDVILRAYRSGDIIVAPSELTRQALERYGVPIRAVIGGGVDPIFHADGRVADSDLPSVVGYFQPGWWVKGAATLLQCLCRLRQRHPRVPLALFGHQASSVQERGSAVCDRFYSGLKSTEVADLLRRHDIFVYPSYSDGFPSPPLEAMACGCAVVTTRVGAAAEYAEHERNALVCDPMDDEGLYCAVDRLLTDAVLRRRLGAQAANDARHWTWRRSAGRFTELFSELHER
jgi:glycosyltransferase involved in cell wall biosynthesis